MSNTGKCSMFAVPGGLLPFLIGMIVCLYPSHSALAATPAATEMPDTTDPPATLKLSVMEIKSATLNLAIMDVPGELESYVDEYLVDSDDPSEWLGAEENQRAGRRLLGAEFVYYQNSSDVIGDATELGLHTTMRQETRTFGNLGADLIFSNLDTDYIGRQRSNSDFIFTLRQTDVPITNHWTMDNILGFLRTATSPVLNGGFRVRLPTSPLLGMSSKLINTNKEFFWFSGKTGYYEGIAMRQFHKDGGKLTGGAYQQEVVPNIWLAGELVTFSGNDLVREHSSVLAAGQYARPDRTMEYDFHLLADNDSNLGLWADGMQYLPNLFQLHYGAFYLQPDLAWMNLPIANNQTGLYIHTDKQAYRYTLSAGYDYLESGLDDDLSRSTNAHTSFFNGNYRFSRYLTLGLNVNLGLRNFSGPVDENQSFWRVNNFMFYKFPVGISRIEIFASSLNSDSNVKKDGRQGINLSHEWRMPQNLRLKTELRLEQTQQYGVDSNYQEAALNFHQDIGDNWTWGVNASVNQNSGNGSSYRSMGINTDMRWNFLPGWSTSLNMLYNASKIDTSQFSLIEFEDQPKSSSFWLTLSYHKASGQPLTNLGRDTGSVGSGRVSGLVFYDENRDFIRQPGEKPASGILVLLDGNYEAMTNSEGRYTFDPVYSGIHRISILTQDLPLPWSLYDETPRRVEVNLRRTGEANFPLVRIN